MRTVPCMAGCEGPMFRGSGSVGSSGASKSDGSWIPRTTLREAVAGGGASVLSKVPCSSVDRVGLAAHERLPLLFGVVLAQRVPDELGVHEDAAQIGVPLEAHAVEIVGLALEPVRARPHGDQRVDRRILSGAPAYRRTRCLRLTE